MGMELTPADSGEPVKVKNKDIPLLADIFCIMQDVKQIEERRLWQQDRMTSLSQHLTGMPGGGGMPRGLDDAYALLSEIEDEDKQRCKEYARKLRKAQRILNGIESQSMRTFVKMKYVMNASDVDIRRELNMTKHGFYRARKCVEDAPCMAAVKWQERYIVTKEE